MLSDGGYGIFIGHAPKLFTWQSGDAPKLFTWQSVEVILFPQTPASDDSIVYSQIRTALMGHLLRETHL